MLTSEQIIAQEAVREIVEESLLSIQYESNDSESWERVRAYVYYHMEALVLKDIIPYSIWNQDKCIRVGSCGMYGVTVQLPEPLLDWLTKEEI